MIKKEWLLAAGAVSAAMAGQNAAAQNAAPDRAGVAAAVNPNASGQLAGGPARVMVVASDVFRDEHIITDAGGQVHLLFLDESALTVGPNSEVVLDKFVYDPQTNSGQLALTAARGAMRFIGGKLSKINPIEIHTQTATIGVRGCTVYLDNVNPGTRSFTAIFAVGIEAQFRDASGNLAASITKPGTAIDYNGSVFGQPYAFPVQRFQALSGRFSGRPQGRPGLVTSTTQRVTSENSGRSPQRNAPNHIIGNLDDVTQANATAPSQIGGNTGGTSLQEKNQAEVSSQTPASSP
ncbi:MAG TPA: FecR domain-containing protein [Candidatus Sulfotelmatobacter sp.]|nr:FecR domain-containing protein [Candidatus Sulfotelmatobacter sp.]